MSHFRVAVFANNPHDFDELLAPYGENSEEYFEFNALTDEEIQKLKNDYRSNNYPSFEEYVTDAGYVNDTVSGVVGFMANPNAKWDWYSLNGGDWQFDMLPGQTYDDDCEARKNQFDYSNKDYRESELIEHYNEMKKLAESTATPKEDEQDLDIRRAKWFMEDYPKLEYYLRCNKLNYPYAFITPDGEWHSPGTVGWFAVSDDTPDSMQAYLDEWEAYVNSKENPYVNFVDCHI